jgi:hypothetical protein
LNPATLPVRLLRHFRSNTTAKGRKWVTLGDVPPPATITRERERRLAETVATLLDQTAAIGKKASARHGDHAKLQTALDTLWKSHFLVDQLDRALSVDDAIAFHTGRSRPAEEKS